MIERIRDIAFRGESLDRIDQIKHVLSGYPGQQLTARQVNYQLIARGLVENTVRNYKKTTSLLANMRYAGLVDWDVIEDRGREPISPSEWDNVSELAESALRSFRLPRWRGQACYVEVWVEKAALAGVLKPIADKHHVTLMVNKGYSSASAMKAAANRFNSSPALYSTLLYLGDHDPSGEDMVRDVRDRLTEFGVRHLEVRKLGLTMDQIRTFNPPPNPAKITDSRAAGYIAKFGTQSWELDALPPNELNQLVDNAIKSLIDTELMAEVIAEENRDKARLRAAVQSLMEAA